MNPDGYEVAEEGECSPEENKVGRLNANMKDLNRNFPNMIEHEDIYENREPETVNVLKWMDSNKFVLSATFFGGELVATYPYYFGLLLAT